MKKKWLTHVGLMVLLLLGVTVVALAQGSAPSPDAAPTAGTNFDVSRLERVTLQDGETFDRTFTGSKTAATGTGQYFVQLADPALAEMWLATQAENSIMTATAAQLYTQRLVDKQTVLSSQVESMGGQVLATYQRVFNGLAVEIDRAQLDALSKLKGVVSISPVVDYERTLDETVPWIGAGAVQSAGGTGAGISVAVLDSGIDYTHEHLGGSGDQADTDQALAEASQPADPALFPTAKVVGGFDFVGSVWPDGPLMPDPNPMDDPSSGIDGHGTHVASIIAGVDTTASGGIGPGVAPGADLYGLKVCSSVSTACSGVALLQAYDWVADPNGDFLFDDRIDVVNLSLGSNYGQPNAADRFALDLVSALGTVVVSSAGNGGNNPYIQGMPSGAASAISVAQSTVPSAFAAEGSITAPEEIAGNFDVVHYPWTAPWDSVIAGEAYHTGNEGCMPEDFPPEVAGKIAVVFRGSCLFSDKVYYAQEAGAVAAVVGLVDESDPFAGAQGSFYGEINITGFNIAKAPSDAILAAQEGGATVELLFDPTVGTPLPDTMVGSSSRGPNFGSNTIKPEIAAPGASVSANSGDQGYSTFGGTSGASPMVAGSVALLLEANGGSGSLTPAEVKALLMNNAETTTWQDAPGGMLNPISRQGAGRVDVAAAVLADAVAWIPAENQAGLSFGHAPVTGAYDDTKTVEVLNLSGAAKNYDVLVTYRYAEDIATGVDVSASTGTLNVPAGGAASFDVLLSMATNVDLFDYPTGGGTFNDGDGLTTAEIDGFVTLYENDTRARVRVAHASPDAPPVNVCIDGVLTIADLAFTDITSYLAVAPGDYLVQVEAAGGATPCAGPFVFDDTLTLAADTDYTLAATGKLGDSTFAPVINVDDNTPPAAKTAHVRVAHLSPDAPPVDIAVTDGPILISGLAFPNTSGEVPVPAGTYDLEVRLAGTDTVVVPLPGTTLDDGVIYTAFAMGEVATDTLGVYLAAERPGGLSLPFHFLPRKAADLSVPEDELTVPNFPDATTLEITNSSAITGSVEVYALMDINPPSFQPPTRDVNAVDLAYVGTDAIPDVFGDGDELFIFMVSTHDTYSHPIPVWHWVWVDLDQDGEDDYLVRNEDLGDGRWVSVQYDLETEEGSAFFFLDSFMNSNTMGLYLLADDDDLSYSFQVYSFDSYFTDEAGIPVLWDVSPQGALESGQYHHYNAAAPAFITDNYFFDVAPNSTQEVLAGALPSGSSQIGLMYRYFNGADEVDAVPMVAPDIHMSYMPAAARQP